MKILFVDDNASVLAAFRRNMRKRFDMITASSAKEAFDFLRSHRDIGVIVSDMKMPDVNGIQFFEKAIEIAPNAIRIMLTGNADDKTATDAVNKGHVYQFLTKPCPVDVLVAAIEDAAHHHELMQVEHNDLEQTVAGCVKMLTDVLGMVAPFALGRGQRLKASLSPFLEVLQIKSLWIYEVSAMLSSIGYTAIPAELIEKLEKGVELTCRESRVASNVPLIGFQLVSDVPKLKKIANNIKYQRKNYDGAGFPEDEISGQSIPLGARMLRVFEDRMDLEREGVSGEDAYEKMYGRTGYYDPKILDLCFKYYPHFLCTTISKEKPVLTLDFDSLEPGHVVVSDICTTSGVLLLEAGNWLTPATIQRMRNYVVLDELSGPFYVQVDLD